MSKTKIFFDTKLTGLHKHNSIISIGLVSECGKTFYAEFKDYNKSQVTDWIEENVVDKLLYNGKDGCDHNFPSLGEIPNDWWCYGKKKDIRPLLTMWLEQFEQVEMWSDCLAYDWVLFCDLYGDAFSIPKNVYYIPFDICTLFKAKGIDPDISREKFGCGEAYTEMPKHNSLWDARVIKMCYENLQK